MRRAILILCFFVAGISTVTGQIISISEARAQGVGAEVTISGVLTNGPELGPIRYIQDATAGLAIYSTDLSETDRGDSITVTGTLKDYNTLLEMDPVTDITIHSGGHELPEPVTLTPAQYSEEYEGMLVRTEEAVFDATGEFERVSYTFSASGEQGQIYINGYDSPLIGEVIPTNPVTLIGPLGAYNDTYQLLPRDQFDMLSSSAINFTSLVELSSLTTTGFTLSWNTDAAGTTEAFYGSTPQLEGGSLELTGETTQHSIDLDGLQPAEIVYVQPFSVLGEDTAKSAMQVYATVSESGGDMKAYFNRPVDQSVSLGLMEAEYLEETIDDTLIAYINRAQESIEFTIYNFNNTGISNISDALNDAHDRGVTVRVIYDGSLDAVGVNSLDAEIGRMESPEPDYPVYGIMHNKFVVFDAQSDDPDAPVVWTGATNFTGGQINTDPNNVIVIQDQSLAKAFQLEFNEMFGSAGPQPDTDAARFGPDKADNTPHEFLIAGKRVEAYFSPSDGTHGKILETIASADHELFAAAMLITKSDIGYDIAEKNDAGVDARVLLNDYDDYGEPIVNTLKQSLAEDVRLTGESGIMHHKYLIVDQGYPESDPVLLTGSHNWSSSAQFRNDENTLIIHDQGVANAYYQEFAERFSNGVFVVEGPECKNEFITMSGGSSIEYDVLFNDELPGDVTLSITRQPANGTAEITGSNTIRYTPDPGFNQDIDTVYYSACLVSNQAVCDEAYMGIFVDLPVSVESLSSEQPVRIYPNPATDRVYIEAGDQVVKNAKLRDLSGRLLARAAERSSGGWEMDLSGYTRGVYLLQVQLKDGRLVTQKVIRR